MIRSLDDRFVDCASQQLVPRDRRRSSRKSKPQMQNDGMSTAGEPITKCPVCRYDLTGLPRNHTCPECGFEYDESMRVWFPRGKTPGWYWIIVSFFTSLFTIHLISYVRGGFSLTSKGLFTLTGDVLILFSWAWSIAVWHTPGPFIVIGSRGLAYRGPFGATRNMPWDCVVFPDGAMHPRRRKGDRTKALLLPIGGLLESDRQIIHEEIRRHASIVM
jgi:hypothetical protein